MKRCRTCGEIKASAEFYSNGPGRFRPDCRGCVLAARRSRYATDPVMRARIQSRSNMEGREYQLMWKYGITEADYQALADAQGDRCAICGSADPGGRTKRWCVDHDHATGAVRGLLCFRCNVGLGCFGDDLATVAGALAYLTESVTSEAKAS